VLPEDCQDVRNSGFPAGSLRAATLAGQGIEPPIPFKESPFIDLENNFYWTSTRVAGTTDFAYKVAAGSGQVDSGPITEQLPYRCVGSADVFAKKVTIVPKEAIPPVEKAK